MSARTPKFYRVIVTGAGSFPIDMLRYDHAVPAHERTSSVIASTFKGLYRKVDVELVMPREPERDRWKSFGWEVTSVMGAYG